jgi:hypothetical protein
MPYLSVEFGTALPYIAKVHTVLTTPYFDREADRVGLTSEELTEIVSTIAADPLAGDLMQGTGGARKLRHAGRGFGKSGGYRTIHYFGGDDVPVFLLSIYGKGEKGNLSKQERNELAKLLPTIADSYRARR